ncbi:hypothetical protein FB567DRAFT_593584 [Paraphoma chrysanthemicola]|uniref:Uncharacterized protein n=1 Tax=Paraphoma chrysanthemicola TaxID=798071 RepID=A0A8K0R4W0_9PLEO|nr:hypothetical protein FB567DRAFT_593584 [Paraphoma chrysanthemicola]
MKLSNIIFATFTSAALAMPVEDGAVEDNVSIVRPHKPSPLLLLFLLFLFLLLLLYFSTITEPLLTPTRPPLDVRAIIPTADMPGPASARTCVRDMVGSF